jgi:hypothetical protein
VSLPLTTLMRTSGILKNKNDTTDFDQLSVELQTKATSIFLRKREKRGEGGRERMGNKKAHQCLTQRVVGGEGPGSGCAVVAGSSSCSHPIWRQVLAGTPSL